MGGYHRRHHRGHGIHRDLRRHHSRHEVRDLSHRGRQADQEGVCRPGFRCSLRRGTQQTEQSAVRLRVRPLGSGSDHRHGQHHGQACVHAGHPFLRCEILQLRPFSDIRFIDRIRHRGGTSCGSRQGAHREISVFVRGVEYHPQQLRPGGSGQHHRHHLRLRILRTGGQGVHPDLRGERQHRWNVSRQVRFVHRRHSPAGRVPRFRPCEDVPRFRPDQGVRHQLHRGRRHHRICFKDRRSIRRSPRHRRQHVRRYGIRIVHGSAGTCSRQV